MLTSLKERKDAIIEAREPFSLILAGALALSTPVFDLIRTAIEQDGKPVLGLPLWAWGPFLAAFLLAWWFLEYAVKLRRRLTPAIDLHFFPDGGGKIRVREEITNPLTGALIASYQTVQIRIQCKPLGDKAPRNCAAFLTAVEKIKSDGGKETAALPDGVQLPWSGTRPGVEEIDLPIGVPRHCAIFKATEKDKKIELFGLVPFTMDGFFDDLADYIFTVAVTAEGLTKEKKVKVSWNGHWDGIKAENL